MIARLTAAFVWIETRLDEGRWFRRAYVILATCLIWKTTLWAMGYAEANAARPGLEVAAVIGGVSSVPGIVATFAFQQYVNSRQGA